MKLFLFLMMLSFAPSSLAEQVLSEFDKALIELNSNNRSSAIRRLQQLSESSPEHYRARWLLLRYTVMDDSRLDMSVAKEVDNEVNELIQLAIQQDDIAYTHFIRSGYARHFKAYETALKEIDLAIAAEPDSVLFNWSKAKTLIEVGKWSRNNEMIYQGIDVFKKTHELAGSNPPPYFTERDYHFQTAYALGRLRGGENCPRAAIDHYLAVTELSETQDSTVAYAWNNISCAYRKAGQCDKAKEASENALKIIEFGNAKTNLKYSEFCLKMQRMGMWSSETP